MPRSATDATRFTATTPHASTKPLPLGSKPPFNSQPTRKPGPAGETPQEKVRRLRAAADRARDAQVSTFDKFLVRGRVWADRAHRFTALSLIFATVVAGGVTVYALGDMMIHNRRKRREFIAEQQALHTSALRTAQLAIDHGTASEEQIKFMDRERQYHADLEAEKAARAARGGIFKRSKDWMLSGLKKEEQGDDVGTSEQTWGYDGQSKEDDSLGLRESDPVRAMEDTQSALTDKAKQAFADEKERQRSGGPLDRIGTKTADEDSDQQPKSGGWTSFMVRR
ncbi:hypothetical protein HYFRA_00008865 [Hymenoscyphus fraxineus]|uniref:Uncharacterized protein n=1 Tax=Hymenoscyphus fraxineus TaxID=746836 RepID=A0A9N9KY55_9HELO|nr:hypothetical protein HYFRA_00008865 [Hymenoscyphus fraxineus]